MIIACHTNVQVCVTFRVSEFSTWVNAFDSYTQLHGYVYLLFGHYRNLCGAQPSVPPILSAHSTEDAIEICYEDNSIFYNKSSSKDLENKKLCLTITYWNSKIQNFIFPLFYLFSCYMFSMQKSNVYIVKWT